MSIYNFYGKLIGSTGGSGGSIVDATKVISSKQFWFTGKDSAAFGTYGQVIECVAGESFYWNGKLATSGSYQTPRMLSALPSVESIYNTSITIGAEVAANTDGSYTATADGAMFFPIVFNKGTTVEGYFNNGSYSDYFITNVSIDSYYLKNYEENYIVHTPFSPITVNGLMENYIPLIGKKVVVLGDSISEQSAGGMSGADEYGFHAGTYNHNGWFSRIARKYGLEYKVHGYGMQWWYCTEARPNGGVKAVNSLVESGYNPDYIILEYGTNDIWTGTFGEATDAADASATSTVGAMRYCIETLQATFPAAKIIVVMPCMRNGSKERQNTYYNLVIPILREYGVRYCDMLGNAGIVASMMNSDGVHLATVNSDYTYNNNTEAVAKYSRCLETELLNL